MAQAQVALPGTAPRVAESPGEQTTNYSTFQRDEIRTIRHIFILIETGLGCIDRRPGRPSYRGLCRGKQSRSFFPPLACGIQVSRDTFSMFPTSFQEVYRKFPLSAVPSSGFQEVSSLFPNGRTPERQQRSWNRN
jgi:hypothetical protein